MSAYLWIGLGSALGGMGRFWLSGWVAQRFETFPMGTLVVNVTGSFLIGFLAAVTGTEGRWLMSPAAREFLLIGVLGGYTTFSSFSWQTLELVREGEWLFAAWNVAGSVVLCLGAVWVGHILAQTMDPRT